MALSTSWAQAERATANRAYVRELLRTRQPAFAAALAAAEQEFSCPACLGRQREMIASRVSARSSDRLPRMARASRPGCREVGRALRGWIRDLRPA